MTDTLSPFHICWRQKAITSTFTLDLHLPSLHTPLLMVHNRLSKMAAPTEPRALLRLLHHKHLPRNLQLRIIHRFLIRESLPTFIKYTHRPSITLLRAWVTPNRIPSWFHPLRRTRRTTRTAIVERGRRGPIRLGRQRLQRTAKVTRKRSVRGLDKTIQMVSGIENMLFAFL